MNYKETVFFIGKCLTINHEEHNRGLVEEQLKNNTVDWDNVVRVSTGHFVFPALYCNLKRANFLDYLPQDLVEYMEHITQLNRERNQELIMQAKEINALLLTHNIRPVFLKGTAFLFQGLYEDIGERMVGDIDFIVPINDFEKAYHFLIKKGYKNVSGDKYHYPSFKHLPRISHPDRIGAVEVHKDMLPEKYADEFNYHSIINNVITENKLSFLSCADQLSLTIIANQINDNAQFKYQIGLRNAYDVFLLSQQTDSIQAITGFKKLFHPLNNFLRVNRLVFNSDYITFKGTNESEKFEEKYVELISNSEKATKFSVKANRKLYVQSRAKIIFNTFTDAKIRRWFFNRITDVNWYKEKFGIK